jgi:hypothetical protein
MHRVYLTAILSLLGHAALADTNINLTVGPRDETHSEDRLPALGFAADFGPDAWVFRPELGITLSFDLVGSGDEAELGAGAIGYWDAAAFTAHFGIGASSLSADLLGDSATNSGLYVHGGLSWAGGWRRIGFDVRYVKTRESNIGGTSVGGGFVQLAFLIGFGW